MAVVADVAVLVIVLSVLAVDVDAQGPRTLGLYEDDICKQERGALWKCKHIDSCPRAREQIRAGGRPDICRFAGSSVIVCCEPDVKPQQGARSKSKEKCREYAKSVYIEVDTGDGPVPHDTCSAVEPLITNGQDAEPMEYPHMALIGYGPKTNIEWLCAGTLISERFVLSAAHCSPGTKKKGPARWVRLGDYNILSTQDDQSGQASSKEYEIIERIDHPDYHAPSVYNDIALYRLNADVVFDEYVRPICLQTDHVFPKTYAIATGWGRTEYGGLPSDVLQKVNLTITDRKPCSDSFRAAIGERLRTGIDDATMFCAGDIENGKDTCQGDSGGPLQLRLSDPYCMYSQIGITSFGSKCGGDKPGVYTRVSAFVPWIESKVWP